MDDDLRREFFSRVAREPFAEKFGLELVEIREGYSKVRMRFRPDMENLFGMAHGGALFALIDEAFETASNSHGTLAVALNMNLTFFASPQPGETLTAEAVEISITRKTATYEIKVRDSKGTLMVACQALVYRKGNPLPFSQQ